MNRIQFWILTGLSALVALLLIAQIILVRLNTAAQLRAGAARQLMAQGEASQSILKQLAVRIFQDSQKTQDQALKDLMTRQQITYNPGTDATNNTENPAPAAPVATPVGR